MLKFFREDVAAGIHRDTEYSNLVDTGYDEYSIDGVGAVSYTHLRAHET